MTTVLMTLYILMWPAMAAVVLETWASKRDSSSSMRSGSKGDCGGRSAISSPGTAPCGQGRKECVSCEGEHWERGSGRR